MLLSAESFKSQDLPIITSFPCLVSLIVLLRAIKCWLSFLITLLTREQKELLAVLTLVARSRLSDPELESGFSNLVTCSSRDRYDVIRLEASSIQTFFLNSKSSAVMVRLDLKFFFSGSWLSRRIDCEFRKSSWISLWAPLSVPSILEDVLMKTW